MNMKINEVIIDNIKGIGAMPDNGNIDYFGFRVLMKPSIFLELTPYISRFSDRVYAMRNYIRQGNAIASPYLKIEIPMEWEHGNFKKIARVYGHEGRHRMLALLQEEGDIPIEVHMAFNFYNKNKVKQIWLNNLNKSLYSQDGDYFKGPFFQLIA